MSIARVQSLLVLGVIVLGAAVFAQDKGLPVSVRIETEAGNIIAELYLDKAPATVANFLRYVDGGSFNGGCFIENRSTGQRTESCIVRIAVEKPAPPR